MSKIKSNTTIAAEPITVSKKELADSNKLRTQALRSMRDKLLELKDTRVEHVCLYGYDTILSNWSNDTTKVIPIFLTKDRREFFRVLGIQHPAANVATVNFDSNDDRSLRMQLIVVEAGRHFLPIRLENECLAKRIVHREQILVPDNESKYWALIYRMLAHQGRFSVEEQQILVPRITSRCGFFVKCQYSDIPHEVKIVIT